MNEKIYKKNVFYIYIDISNIYDIYIYILLGNTIYKDIEGLYDPSLL